VKAKREDKKREEKKKGTKKNKKIGSLQTSKWASTLFSVIIACHYVKMHTTT